MLRQALLITVALTACSKKDTVCGEGTVMKDGKCVFPEVVNRPTNESEALAVLAEFRLRQEQYHLENGEYLSTGGEAAFFPTIEGDSGALANPPEAWRVLRIALSGSPSARCGYSSPAGKPEQAGSIGRIGKAFNFKPPVAGNWFYVIARCPAVEKFYFSSVHGDGVGSKSFSEIE